MTWVECEVMKIYYAVFWLRHTLCLCMSQCWPGIVNVSADTCSIQKCPELPPYELRGQLHNDRHTDQPTDNLLQTVDSLLNYKYDAEMTSAILVANQHFHSPDDTRQKAKSHNANAHLLYSHDCSNVS